jgi:hypothetical protein
VVAEVGDVVAHLAQVRDEVALEVVPGVVVPDPDPHALAPEPGVWRLTWICVP